VIIEAEINLATKTSKDIEVDIWYSSIYELAQTGWDFRHFSLMEDVFQGKVHFQPRTLFRSCLYCSPQVKDEQCILNGKYCPYMPQNVQLSETANHLSKISPKEVIDQSLREQCMYESIKGGTKSHWFNYMRKVLEECILKGKSKTDIKKLDAQCHKDQLIVKGLFDM